MSRASPCAVRRAPIEIVLRADRSLAAEYRAVKVALAARFGSDRDGHTDTKTAFIRSVVERARSSGVRTGFAS